MSITITQTCDGCKTTREIVSVAQEEQVGWRRIPIKGEFGKSRSEQPTLCPKCLTHLTRIINAGIVHEEPAEPEPVGNPFPIVPTPQSSPKAP